MSRRFPFATLLVIPVLLAAAAGCDKPSTENGTNNQNTDPGTQPSDEPYFTTDIPDLINTDSSLEHYFGYSTNLDDSEVQITSSEDWCLIEYSSGSVNMRVSRWGRDTEKDGRDAYPAPRSCMVTIIGGSIFTKTVTVCQESDAGLIQTPNYMTTLYVNPSGGTETLTIDTNCIGLTARTDADWIKAEFIDRATLQIVTQPHPDNVFTPRTAGITICSVVNDSKTINLTVKENDPELSSGRFGYEDHTNWD